eukprot:symbB.v1.2.010261.t1/scaffold670.1/size174347/12
MAEHRFTHEKVGAESRSQNEKGCRIRVAHLRGQHHEESTEATSLENRATELQYEGQQLEKDISTTQRQKENLTSTLSMREEEHQAQLVRQEELNNELEELKKKCRCTIS